jgi:hypothetical protein
MLSALSHMWMQLTQLRMRAHKGPLLLAPALCSRDSGHTR